MRLPNLNNALLLLATLLAGSCATPSARQPLSAGDSEILPPVFSRAIFADGTLWLLSRTGQLTSIREGEEKRVPANFPAPVLDIAMDKDRPLAIVCERESCEQWLLYRLTPTEWKLEARIASNGDELHAIAPGTDEILLLTSHRLVTIKGSAGDSVNLRNFPETFPIAAVLNARDGLYVGLNKGEWGGGLGHIDKQTGRTRIIESKASGEVCGTPLDAECDPVNALIPSPWIAGCILAGIGMDHLESHGRIIEICGSRIQRRYLKAVEGFLGDPNAPSGKEEPYPSESFHDLVAKGERLWALGSHGLYQVKADGRERTMPFPAFQAIDRAWVSFLPDFILVMRMAGAQERGYYMIMVPR